MKKVSGNAKVKMISAVLFCAALTGCSGAGSETQTQSSEAASQAQTQAETQMADRVETEAGALLLSVNPEIQVIYSESGTVLDLKGMNEAGKNVVEGCSDYKGAPCTQDIFRRRLADMQKILC